MTVWMQSLVAMEGMSEAVFQPAHFTSGDTEVREARINFLRVTPPVITGSAQTPILQPGKPGSFADFQVVLPRLPARVYHFRTSEDILTRVTADRQLSSVPLSI